MLIIEHICRSRAHLNLIKLQVSSEILYFRDLHCGKKEEGKEKKRKKRGIPAEPSKNNST